MKKYIYLSLLNLVLLSYAHAQTADTTTPIKATATLLATCSIKTNNLSIGMIILPITSQSASSQMEILCSKEAPYTIDIAYGGVYGQGMIAQTDYASGWYQTSRIGSVYQFEWFLGNTKITSSNDKFGNPGQSAEDAARDLGLVYMSGPFGTHYYKASPAYEYGKIQGVTKGDSIGYSIQLPNQPSKIWNYGVNSYSSIGIGQSETIPVVLKLIPGQTSVQYPAPDIYRDTVSATISY